MFGVNYDTPTNIQIHTSASQLSAPGSYMLAPSYSEALLMEPTIPSSTASAQPTASNDNPTVTLEPSDMVPSYSEALLYERASAEHQPKGMITNGFPLTTSHRQYQHASIGLGLVCDCPCHGLVRNTRQSEFSSQDSLLITTNNEFSMVDNANVQRTRRPVRCLYKNFKIIFY